MSLHVRQNPRFFKFEFFVGNCSELRLRLVFLWQTVQILSNIFALINCFPTKTWTEFASDLHCSWMLLNFWIYFNISTFVLFKMKRVRFFGNSSDFGISVRLAASQIKSIPPPAHVWVRQLLDLAYRIFDLVLCREMSSGKEVCSKYSSLKMHWKLRLGVNLGQTVEGWVWDVSIKIRKIKVTW